MRRGEVFWANLTPRPGAEQAGRRPVVVVSHEGFNEAPRWLSVIVVPLSPSAAQARRGPTAVLLPPGSGALKKGGVALCHQVTRIDRGKLTDRVGVLSGAMVSRLDDGLRAALDLE